MDAATEACPDVVLLEAHGNRAGDAFALVPLVGRTSKHPRAMMIGETCTSRFVTDCVRAGAYGCLLRASEPAERIRAVHAVLEGEVWFARATMFDALLSHIRPRPAEFPVEDGKLTRREAQVLSLTGRGMSNKQIARDLRISDKTVKTHLHRIYAKLHMSRRSMVLQSALTHEEPRSADEAELA